MTTTARAISGIALSAEGVNSAVGPGRKSPNVVFSVSLVGIVLSLI